MENQLEYIRKSYDKGIELGSKGISLYENLPAYITNDPDYPLYRQSELEGSTGSGHKEIRDYLSPDATMNFIDLGCCLNLMFRGYDAWPSSYHGVDISGETIRLLEKFVAKKKLSVGSLYCGSIHQTPFTANSFDIGACIGVLEYFEKDYVSKAIREIHRILKPQGKLVLDVPNIGNPACRVMMLIEAYLGRPDLFDMTAPEFEDMLREYFTIENLETGAMRLYFLTCKK